jgi:hypothetical protein
MKDQAQDQQTQQKQFKLPIQVISFAHGDILTTSGGSTPMFKQSTSATLTVFICKIENTQ